MAEFILAIGEVLAGILVWVGSITTTLIGNVFIQLMFGFIVFVMLVKLLVGFIKRRR